MIRKTNESPACHHRDTVRNEEEDGMNDITKLNSMWTKITYKNFIWKWHDIMLEVYIGCYNTIIQMVLYETIFSSSNRISLVFSHLLIWISRAFSVCLWFFAFQCVEEMASTDICHASIQYSLTNLPSPCLLLSYWLIHSISFFFPRISLMFPMIFLRSSRWDKSSTLQLFDLWMLTYLLLDYLQTPTHLAIFYLCVCVCLVSSHLFFFCF